MVKNYQKKYLKYKSKYYNLKQEGGDLDSNKLIANKMYKFNMYGNGEFSISFPKATKENIENCDDIDNCQSSKPILKNNDMAKIIIDYEINLKNTNETKKRKNFFY